MAKSSCGDEAGSPESAASYVGGSSTATPRHEESYDARIARSKAEESKLAQWAADNGKLGGKIFTPEDLGGEHNVSYDPKTNRYLKSTRPDANLGYGIALTDSGLGATPSEYLDRLALNNRYFGDDVWIERVVMRGGKPVIVTSQPFVDGPPASPRQIIGKMAEAGFKNIAPGAFYNGDEGILVSDLYPRNVKLS